jgi:ribosomal protein S18 acetylase RimI-like enzyme
MLDHAAHILVRQLEANDADDYRNIRLAALKNEPDAFGSTYDAESTRTTEEFAQRLATSTAFGAYGDGQIVGLGGFKREAGAKDGHKAFVWGIYVDASWRGRGVASALMAAIIGSARESVEQLTLAVVRGNESALGLYRKFGFRVYGIEPRALKTSMGYVDEVLMSLIFERT